MERVRIGLTGAVHPNMPGDDTGLYAPVIERMTALAGDRSDSTCPSTASRSAPRRTGGRARDFMDGERVDFTLLFNASLPYGRVILPLARVRSRLGLWSVPEPTRDGVLQLNSFCGTNMLGSIVGNYLRHHRIRFKWFYGLPGSDQFLERFRVTLRALQALKRLSAGARVAQIGGLADGFENLYFDERHPGGALRHHRCRPATRSRRSCSGPRRYSERDVAAEVQNLRGEGRLDPRVLRTEHVERSTRVFLALRDFARENGYDALALSCWSRFQQVYGVAVCAAMSRLNQLGRGRALRGRRDLGGDDAGHERHERLAGRPQRPGRLRRGGPEPQPLALRRGPGLLGRRAPASPGTRTSTSAGTPGEAWQGDGVVAEHDLPARGGDRGHPQRPARRPLPAHRRGDGEARLRRQQRLGGPPGGSTASRSTCRTLLNTIVVRRVNHHYPTAFGDLTDELNELAAWAGIAVLDPVPYRPYLQHPTWGRPAVRPGEVP